MISKQNTNTPNIYLDNAASTPIEPDVVEAMSKCMLECYGNPSSTHQSGRKAKSMIEHSRTNIAKHFNAQASEIIFNSGGTEGNNHILINAVENLGVTKIISSKIEHHAVLNTLLHLQKKHKHLQLAWVNHDEKGTVDYDHLKEILEEDDSKKLVSLMMVNNEIGNVLDLKKVSKICQSFTAYFHTDAVQAIGRLPIDVQETPIDFLVASAHKFYGPRGVGFMYVKKGIPVNPILFGGAQEKGSRPGTENVAGIIGMQKALEISMKNLNSDSAKILKLKKHFITKLNQLGNFEFNGLSGDLNQSIQNILNIRFPFTNKLTLFELDLKGIATSSGSACQSGGTKGSHVLKALLKAEEATKTSVRFSFSKFNTLEEIDYTVNVIAELLRKNKQQILQETQKP